MIMVIVVLCFFILLLQFIIIWRTLKVHFQFMKFRILFFQLNFISPTLKVSMFLFLFLNWSIFFIRLVFLNFFFNSFNYGLLCFSVFRVFTSIFRWKNVQIPVDWIRKSFKCLYIYIIWSLKFILEFHCNELFVLILCYA